LIDDDAANQHVGGIWNRLTTFLHILKTELNRLANVRQRFFDRFSLRIASGKRWTNDYVTAVLVRFEQYLEIEGFYISMLTRLTGRDKHHATT
jgi:hypothetical protein